MINLYKQDGETIYGIKEFLLDSPEDLSNLPTNIRSGSSALIISTGDIYFLNGSKQWVAIGKGASGEGDSSSCSCEEVLGQLDSDGDGIVDFAERSGAITMYEM